MSLGTFALGTTGGSAPNKPLVVVNVSFTGDTSYPTGGSTGIAAKVNVAAVAGGVYLGDITKANILMMVPGLCGGYDVKYDAANDKLVVRYADYDAGADGPLIEVPNTTALNATTFNLSFLVA